MLPLALTPIRKKFIILFFFALTMLIMPQPCFSQQTQGTITSTISLNNAALYDIEILLLNDGRIYLPFKQLSEIFEVNVKTEHATKDIYFETSDNKKGRVGKNLIELDGKIISKNGNFYVKSGLMEDIKDEIFCSAEDLSKIFNAVLTTDANDLSVCATVERELELLKTFSALDNENPQVPKIRAYKDITSPAKRSKFYLSSMGVNNNMMSNTASQFLQDRTQKNVSFNNNAKVTLKGSVCDGDLSMDLKTYNHKGELFSFGGMGVNYRNEYKNHYYELGKIRGFQDGEYSIATRAVGVQLENYNREKENYKDVSGYVETDSLVKVYVNDAEYATLSTYDGYYSLNDLYLNDKDVSIRLEELKSDGTTKFISEKTYSKNSGGLPKDKNRYGLLAGWGGFNDNLFSQNGYIYEMNTKKFILGADHQHWIAEKNILADSKIIYDKIISRPQNSVWQNIYPKDAFLNSGVWKNPNNLEGITSLNTFEYIKDENLRYKLILGISNSSDVTESSASKSGYNVRLGAQYDKDFYSLKAYLYTISPDFHLAGSEGDFGGEKTGVSLIGNLKKNGYSLNANCKKYLSNLQDTYEGGILNFTECSLNTGKDFKKLFAVNFNINGREGSNDYARNINYYYNLNFSRKLWNKIHLQLGKNESNYQTDYKQADDHSSFKSLYSMIYLKADYQIPRNKGALSLGHDSVTYDYNGKEEKRAIARIGYTFPEIKRLTLSTGLGYGYTDSNNGLDYGINLAYRTKSGRTFNINYQYNKNSGYILNNMYLPANSRHSINLAFNDAFAIMPSGLKSIGRNDDKKGFVEVISYIDKNDNGKFDRKDIKVRGVPIKCSWLNDEILTNTTGRAFLGGAAKGVRKVSIDLEKLPATLLVEKNQASEKFVRIDPRQTTKVEFPLKSCVGNISGKLKVVDDYDRKMNISEFIVVLNDEKGNEAAYTTVDSDGNFYLSGVHPGKYILELDKSFVETNGLGRCEDKSTLKIDIPYNYKKFTDIKNLVLIYKTYAI